MTVHHCLRTLATIVVFGIVTTCSFIAKAASTTTPPALASGTITQSSADSITITPKTGSPVTVAIDASTVVKVNGKVATAADLKTGMTAIAFGTAGQAATEIRSYTPKPPATHPAPVTPAPNITGVISEVGDGTVTVQPKTGDVVTVTLNDATVVKVNGKVATAADLKVGMHIAVFAQPNSPATEIRAYTPTPPTTKPSQPLGNNVSGLVTAVTDSSITIQPNNGSATTVSLNTSTIVKVNGAVASASDLKAGMRAIAFFSVGQASEIRAYQPKPTTNH